MNSTFESIAAYWLSWVMSATWQLALLIAIVATAVWIGRRASPRFRYALWLLVLVKVFLPPTLAIGWGVGNWGVRPLWNSVESVAQPLWEAPREIEQTVENAVGADLTVESLTEKRSSLGNDKSSRWSPTLMLFAIWGVGCLVLLQPRIVIPNQMVDKFQESDLDSVLLHELSHWRRRDPWIGWLQVLG